MHENDLKDLLAREAIRDLPVRYCDCVWRDDIAGLVDLFTDDGSFIAIFEGVETSVTGRDNLREFYANATDFMPRPYIHNHVVELTADGFAQGRCYLDLRSARNNMDWLGAGYYEDQYEKVGDRWKFKSRHFTALRIDTPPEGFESGD